ncbi:hypothetical protein [Massilia sp. PWRC2]|uniref:hypothetical protein n=1 Tax=Massilia sp. PWRC2 TaxID=2804626 RepID=UPI003CF2F4EC
MAALIAELGTRLARAPARVLAPLPLLLLPLLLLAADISAAAARITAPAGAPASSTPSAMTLPAATRAAMAGYYQLGANRVAVVAVTATGLSMKINMEPALALLAESDTRFFVPATDLRVQFDRANGSMTLSLAGAAAGPAPRTDAAAVERADAYVAARVASGQPLAGGAAIVQRNVGAREQWQLHAADFSPALLRQAQQLMPLQRQRNAAWGAVQAVRFDGVNRWGWDCYQVRYASRTVRWGIWLDADGRLAAATILPPPR